MPKPKIYTSHPAPSIEEVAKWVGVSRRRMKELVALAAEINGAKAPRANGNKRGRDQARHTTSR